MRKVGDLVVAKRSLGEREPGAGLIIYAFTGDFGQIIAVDHPDWPTVRWDSTGCVTDVTPDEISDITA
jgi:hypothetical protein